MILLPSQLSLAPAVPVLDSVVAADGQNTVSWHVAGGVGTYNLYWSTGGAYTKIATVTSPYVHRGLQNGLAVSYYATVTYLGVESLPSNVIVGTPVFAAFTVQVTTTTTPQDFKLYLAGANALRITWGDTQENTYTGGDGVKTHSYATPGTYTITFVSGTATRICFGGDGGAGTTPTLLTALLTPVSTSYGLTSAKDMFRGCTGLGNTGWCADFFSNASAAVTNMSYMFSGCTAFNQSVANFNTAAVTNMSYMFYGCTAFNQSVANINTAAVTNMSYMFSGCTAFNQNISGFDVHLVTDMTSMLQSSAFAKTNYDLLLVAWAAQAVKSSVPFHAGTAHYSAGAPTTARGVLTGAPNNWTITDGGTP